MPKLNKLFEERINHLRILTVHCIECIYQWKQSIEPSLPRNFKLKYINQGKNYLNKVMEDYHAITQSFTHSIKRSRCPLCSSFLHQGNVRKHAQVCKGSAAIQGRLSWCPCCARMRVPEQLSPMLPVASRAQYCIVPAGVRKPEDEDHRDDEGEDGGSEDSDREPDLFRDPLNGQEPPGDSDDNDDESEDGYNSRRKKKPSMKNRCKNCGVRGVDAVCIGLHTLACIRQHRPCSKCHRMIPLIGDYAEFKSLPPWQPVSHMGDCELERFCNICKTHFDDSSLDPTLSTHVCFVQGLEKASPVPHYIGLDMEARVGPNNKFIVTGAVMVYASVKGNLDTYDCRVWSESVPPTARFGGKKLGEPVRVHAFKPEECLSPKDLLPDNATICTSWSQIERDAKSGRLKHPEKYTIKDPRVIVPDSRQSERDRTRLPVHLASNPFAPFPSTDGLPHLREMGEVLEAALDGPDKVAVNTRVGDQTDGDSDNVEGGIDVNQTVPRIDEDEESDGDSDSELDSELDSGNGQFQSREQRRVLDSYAELLRRRASIAREDDQSDADRAWMVNNAENPESDGELEELEAVLQADDNEREERRRQKEMRRRRAGQFFDTEAIEANEDEDAVMEENYDADEEVTEPEALPQLRRRMGAMVVTDDDEEDNDGREKLPKGIEIPEEDMADPDSDYIPWDTMDLVLNEEDTKHLEEYGVPCYGEKEDDFVAARKRAIKGIGWKHYYQSKVGRFSNRDLPHNYVLDAMFGVLLSDSHFFNSTVVSHNGGAFDVILLADYLQERGVNAQLITNGNKVISMHIPGPNITFVDSLKFLPMSLDKAARSMGLKSGKGYFPYKLNVPGLYALKLDGPPPAEAFDVAPERRESLEKWLKEVEREPYNLAAQSLIYNYEDTILLVMIFMAFIKCSLRIEADLSKDLPVREDFKPTMCPYYTRKPMWFHKFQLNYIERVKKAWNQYQAKEADWPKYLPKEYKKQSDMESLEQRLEENIRPGHQFFQIFPTVIVPMTRNAPTLSSYTNKEWLKYIPPSFPEIPIILREDVESPYGRSSNEELRFVAYKLATCEDPTKMHSMLNKDKQKTFPVRDTKTGIPHVFHVDLWDEENGIVWEYCGMIYD